MADFVVLSLYLFPSPAGYVFPLHGTRTAASRSFRHGEINGNCPATTQSFSFFLMAASHCCLLGLFNFLKAVLNVYPHGLHVESILKNYN